VLVELGFDTIGNATLIVYDGGPLLVTDPWFEGDAYFGSWTRSHLVPAEQLEAILAAQFYWISHGHPDHLSMVSLRRRPAARILLADHVGGRIAAALRDDGFTVSVLADRTWTALSDHVRVCSIADYNQDSILLVDIAGTLVVNMNDAVERGSRSFVREAVRRSKSSFLLQQVTFGDADMINVFDEAGDRIPSRAALREPPGPTLAALARRVGTRFVVPFSSMHQYQRADSIWANDHVTRLDDYRQGFASDTAELLPAFVRYDAAADTVTALAPPEQPRLVKEPEAFGDDWEEPLEARDRTELDAYFASFPHLARAFAFIAFDVAGETHAVVTGQRRRGRTERGLTFAAPRAALMTAVHHRVFDDLLIGNFVRTTVHGEPDPDALYPDFTPFVCKYGDNGGARTPDELHAYFRAYRARAPLDYLRHRLERTAADRVRGLVPRGSLADRVGRQVYQRVVSVPARRA
jgi:hypothetical protein